MKRLACATLLLCGAIPCTLFGGSITIGVYDLGNQIPFGGINGGTRFQEAYAAADFSGPISITGIDFSLNNAEGNVIYSATYQLSFSIFTGSINGLSQVNFNGNIGSNSQLFTTKVLSGAPPSTLTFLGNTPYVYDPSLGNLLLDVQITNVTFTPGFGSGPVYWASEGFATSPTNATAQYQNFSSVDAVVGGGLVTEFDFSNGSLSSPEPGSLVLLGGGLAAFFIRRRCHR